MRGEPSRVTGTSKSKSSYKTPFIGKEMLPPELCRLLWLWWLWLLLLMWYICGAYACASTLWLEPVLAPLRYCFVAVVVVVVIVIIINGYIL